MAAVEVLGSESQHVAPNLTPLASDQAFMQTCARLESLERRRDIK